RVTAHQCDGSVLPLADESLDRLTTRNTIIYVGDPERTIREFRPVLRTGGKVHAIEGDWPMMIIEPVPSKDWVALVDAASHACRTPDIGRKLYGLRTWWNYARGSGKMNPAEAEKILSTIEQAIPDGSYLALAPQFVVTGTR